MLSFLEIFVNKSPLRLFLGGHGYYLYGCLLFLVLYFVFTSLIFLQAAFEGDARDRDGACKKVYRLSVASRRTHP